MAITVAIVGAGCAGLGAAASLLHQTRFDVDVTLIDPNDWLGGRACVSAVPGLPVDLGPQFIQDPSVNPWARIMRSLGYPGLQVPMTTLYRRQEGQGWETVPFNQRIVAMDGQLDDQFQIASGFSNAPVLQESAAQLFAGQQDMRLSLGSSGYGAIAESAEPWQYVASDQARQADVEPEDNIYVYGGLGNMVFAYGQELQRNKNLTSKKAAITSITDKSAEQVSLDTSDGETIRCDFCIVTIPVGEVGKIEFSPELPGDRVRANGFVKLGSYKKVGFRPTRFPSQDPDSIKTRHEYYIYDKDRDGVWQYFRLPTDESILLCIAAGDFAHALDLQSNDAVADSIIALLQQSYPAGDFTPLPTGEGGPSIAITNWTEEPHIHGAYSYTHYDSTLDPDNPVPLEARDRIAAPHGRVHFAGEATWPDAYGTIHGAFRSGERAAGEIMEILARQARG